MWIPFMSQSDFGNKTAVLNLAQDFPTASMRDCPSIWAAEKFGNSVVVVWAAVAAVHLPRMHPLRSELSRRYERLVFNANNVVKKENKNISRFLLFWADARRTTENRLFLRAQQLVVEPLLGIIL